MASVGHYLRWLLPNGSRPNAGGEISQCPSWPPDMFAVAATLVELSECYTQACYTTPGTAGFVFDDVYSAEAEDAAKEWCSEGIPPAAVQEWWNALLATSDVAVAERGTTARSWQNAALRLLAAADEAGATIGFYRERRFASVFFDEYVSLLQDRPRNLQLPDSICWMVPPDRACVQPKTNTPQPGCNLRSLSHNLALLPPASVVRTRWNLTFGLEQRQALPGEQPAPDLDNPARYEEASTPLRLLLLPFPYRIGERCFLQTAMRQPAPPGVPAQGYFDLEPLWLHDSIGRKQTAAAAASDLDAFITRLIKEAELDHERIDALVMPEAALTKDVADRLADRLPESTKLRWFVCGVTGSLRPGDLLPANAAAHYRFRDGDIGYHGRQRKHHRWCLDPAQIRQYSLGRVLPTSESDGAGRSRPLVWWERIALDQREIHFYRVRRGACMTAIVCEDLARHDPVMPVLRSVGPNLVIALLMDGPQLQNRWPARSAMVLADDPGCSVLTLTSLGMVRRSGAPQHGDSRAIALWKEPGGSILELKLPAGDHGLVLTLHVERMTQVTLDNRSDGGLTSRLKLSDICGVRLAARDAAQWLNLD